MYHISKFFEYFAFIMKVNIVLYAILAAIPYLFMLFWNCYLPFSDIGYIDSLLICFIGLAALAAV